MEIVGQFLARKSQEELIILLKTIGIVL